MAATTELSGRWYTSRESAKNLIGIDSSISDKDAQIDKHIIGASELIEQYTKRRFIPWTGTKTFDYQGTRQLVFGDDLLSISSISDDDGTISSSNNFLYPLDATDDNHPYLYMELLYTSEWFAYDDTAQSVISITGKWGYSERLREATTLGAHITGTSDKSFTATDGSLVAIGQTIKIDDEQMFISNISSNTVTVERAMNGTTAVTHGNATEIYVVEPDPRIKTATEALVARALHRADTAWSDRAGDPGMGFTYYRNLPTEIKMLLDGVKRIVNRPVRSFAKPTHAWVRQ